MREKSRAKSKPTQARRRILYVQTGIDFHRLMCEPCCATQQNQALDFRLGSEADISLSQTNVRFTPESGHRYLVCECPLCAKSGLLQCKMLSPLWAKTEHELAAG